MSRKQYDLTVNTGGEMGEILDHLVCASDPKIRRQDARDALRLHSALRAENEKLRGVLLEEVTWLQAAQPSPIERLNRIFALRTALALAPKEVPGE